MQVRIADIKIGDRFRKEIGDLGPMAESIRRNGLLQHIAITSENELLIGHRRLLACRDILKWEYIEATVLDVDDPLGAQTDENIQRKDFTVSECVAIAQLIEEKEALEAKGRQQEAGQKHGKGQKAIASADSAEAIRADGEAKVKAAKAVGMGRQKLARAQEVVQAAKEDPEKYGEIKEKMDKNGNVSLAYLEMVIRRRQDEMENMEMEPLENKGKFNIILADPPWKFEDGATTPNRTAEIQYPLMTLDEIKALPVKDISLAKCVLFLWVPNSKGAEAHEVVKAWGFEYKTNFAWIKDKIGLGSYNRQRHEILYVATKGSPGAPAPKARHDSVVEAPREEHSKKPDVFYDIIESMYPWSVRIELFARAQRPGWEVWGYEAPGG